MTYFKGLKQITYEEVDNLPHTNHKSLPLPNTCLYSTTVQNMSEVPLMFRNAHTNSKISTSAGAITSLTELTSHINN